MLVYISKCTLYNDINWKVWLYTELPLDVCDEAKHTHTYTTYIAAIRGIYTTKLFLRLIPFFGSAKNDAREPTTITDAEPPTYLQMMKMITIIIRSLRFITTTLFLTSSYSSGKNELFIHLIKAVQFLG